MCIRDRSSESIIDCTTSYIITRTWTATDVCGNSSIAEQVVTVEGDASAPTLVGIPADETVECDAIPVVNQSLISATDNCDTSVDIAFTENTIPGACVHSFTLERIWTATDDCGNTSIETQQIVVEDTTAPVLSGAPIDETVSCGAIPNPAVTLVASDNCDPNITVCLLYTSPSPRDRTRSRMPSSA